MERDEIYLIDMWRLLVREWRWFVAMVLLALACTFALTSLLKPQWEATASILIGQVGQVPPGQDPKAEPLQRVLERLQYVPFQNEVLQSLGIPVDSPDAGRYRASIKLEPMPYAGPMVRLTLRASSRELASRLAVATVDRLRAIHQHLQETPLALARARLAEVQAELSSAEAERDQLKQAGASASREGKEGGGAASTLLPGVLLASKNDNIRELQQTRGDLQLRLSPSFTYETSLMWPVYVPERPKFPNRPLMWGVGTLAGLCLGAFAAVVRDAVRRAAVRRSTLESVINPTPVRDRHSTKATEGGTHA